VEQLIVVTHPTPIDLDARPLEHEAVPDGSIGLAYFHGERLIARGIVTQDAVEAIRSLLHEPVSLALAASEDDGGNIDARVCLVLPLDREALRGGDGDDEPEEPWKASVPEVPSFEQTADGEATPPHLALLPIGNVVRNARQRNHPDDVAGDAREMLENLLQGRARDAVAEAIDELLRGL
jgi:hypothetical protein